MADESFPTINYVPIDKGGGGEGILDALMKVYGAYKGVQQDKNTDFYLAHHGPPGVNNRGDMAGAQQMAQYGNTQADASMRTASANRDNTEANYAGDKSNQDWSKIAQEQVYQKGMLDNDTTKTKQEGAYQTGMLANDQTRTADQAQNSQLTRQQAMSSEDDKLAAAKAVTGEKVNKDQQVSKDRLIGHFQARMNSGVPLTPGEQSQYDALIASDMKGAGVEIAQPASAAAPQKSALADASFGGAAKPSSGTADFMGIHANDARYAKEQSDLMYSFEHGGQPPPQTQPAAPTPVITPEMLQRAWGVLPGGAGAMPAQGGQTSPTQPVAPPTPEQQEALLQLIKHIHHKLTGTGLRPAEQPQADWTNPGEIAAQPGVQ